MMDGIHPPPTQLTPLHSRKEIKIKKMNLLLWQPPEEEEEKPSLFLSNDRTIPTRQFKVLVYWWVDKKRNFVNLSLGKKDNIYVVVWCGMELWK
jgi:hypothetical protein